VKSLAWSEDVFCVKNLAQSEDVFCVKSLAQRGLLVVLCEEPGTE